MVETMPRGNHSIEHGRQLDRLAAVRDDIAHFEAGLAGLRREREQLLAELLGEVPIEELTAAAGMTRTSLYRAARRDT